MQVGHADRETLIAALSDAIEWQRERLRAWEGCDSAVEEGIRARINLYVAVRKKLQRLKR